MFDRKERLAATRLFATVSIFGTFLLTEGSVATQRKVCIFCV
jgi:hypothetical protein